MGDWDYVLGQNKNWLGTNWTEEIVNSLNGSPDINPEFLLTGGPGLLNTEAWLFKKGIPSINIIGCEPQIDRYKNIKNSFPGELHNVALAAESCEMNGWMGHATGETDVKLNTPKENQRYYKKETISCVTIDSLLENQKGPGIVWLDIEGSELSAVRGAIKSMHTGKIFGFCIELSFQDHLYEKSMMLIDLLFRYGYLIVATTTLSVQTKFEIGQGITFKCLTRLKLGKADTHCDVFFVHAPKCTSSFNPNDDLYIKIETNFDYHDVTPSVTR